MKAAKLKKVAGFTFALVLMGIMNTLGQQSRWVDSTFASMTLEEKVGQLFVADLVAVYSNRESPNFRLALEWVNKYHVGGFVLAGGIVTDIALMTNALQRESRIPLLINGDLEGGLWFNHPYRWQRGRAPELPKFIGGGGTSLPSLMAIGATRNTRYAYEFGRITGEEARAVGIHWTNSPVADVNINPNNPIINTRSFGEEPHEVARMVEAYVRGAQSVGLMATVKHFPGHGDTQEDTHMKLPMLPFDRARLDSIEFVPFSAGIKAGVKAVMTAHIALPKIDPAKRPATLSPVMMTDILRRSLGFNGVIVTDGMTMQGVTDNNTPDEAAVKAIEAGVDVVLVPEDFSRAYDGVLRAVKSGRISPRRLDQSVRRVLEAKQWVGIDRQRLVNVDAISNVVGSPKAEAIADSMFRDAVTLLRNEGGLLPLKKKARMHIVSITDEPDFFVGEALGDVVRGSVQSVTTSRLWNGSSAETIDQIGAQLRNADVIILGVYVSIGAWKGENKFSADLENFFKELSRTKKPVVTIAFGDPYVLGKMPLGEGMIATYAGLRKSEEAVGRALVGASEVIGTLPVTIPGRFKRGDGIHLVPAPSSGDR
jgi:beta-N-acetylhexosaminidase